jgi:hypothetical protein
MADDKKNVKSAGEASSENQEQVEQTNQDVEQASKEAAKRLEGKTREGFNTTDAVLGADEDHYKNVREAQAASFGEEYDEKNDPELHPEINYLDVATPSQSQNNLKHPAIAEYTDPHMSKNYLGQPI